MALRHSGQVKARAGEVKSREARFLNDGNRDNACLKPNFSLPSLLSDRRRPGSNEYRARDFSERERTGFLSLQLQKVGHVEEDMMECRLLGSLSLEETNVEEDDAAMRAAEALAVDGGLRLAELEVGAGVCELSGSKRCENGASVSQDTIPSCRASSSNRAPASSSVSSSSNPNCNTVLRYLSSSTKLDWQKFAAFWKSDRDRFLDAIVGRGLASCQSTCCGRGSVACRLSLPGCSLETS